MEETRLVDSDGHHHFWAKINENSSRMLCLRLQTNKWTPKPISPMQYIGRKQHTSGSAKDIGIYFDWNYLQRSLFEN